MNKHWAVVKHVPFEGPALVGRSADCCGRTGIVLAEREGAVQVVLREVVGLDVLVLRAELDVVIAALVGQEPGERVLDLVGVVDARLRGVGLLIGEGLERQRRVARRPGRGRCR